jgi:hypothetical protein
MYKTSSEAYKAIFTKAYSKYGASMGRCDINTCNKQIVNGKVMYEIGKLFDRAVTLYEYGCYDKGGAYWGQGAQLRVEYNIDLTFVRFYRKGDK